MNIGDKIKKCECGCGNWIIYKFKHRWGKIPEYLSGHNLKKRRPWNKGLNKSIDIRVKTNVEKAGKTLKRLYAEGKIKPYSHWKNKNLSTEHRKKISEGNKGKRMSLSSRKKISLSVKDRIKRGLWICPSKSIVSRIKKSKTMKKIRTEQPDRYKAVYGKDHHMWIDGRSYLKYPYEFKLIRKGILNRDFHICQECGSSEKLEVHHIDHNKNNNDPFNLISLCNSCHTKERGKIFVNSFIYKTILFERLFDRNLVEIKGNRVIKR